ncbi:unnamed protein product (macronuclear) [Paramecium tetraurelia]|uniref:Fungal lipase-type domain-containing protein n=1 Tax=Paramecium tetraurelia TaxID=5888 RepID=A0CFD7_PARTE|nr:uncharacterized protein GSPATT00037943001 [Paramecium tetraurelia]CAK69504.1 unnamed protein product [Paramecium tetraurelia]|eukprot:XP_001436901.1 hypothetical protein (macronuclear) [Paramecium tetraurelia strain d4-2]
MTYSIIALCVLLTVVHGNVEERMERLMGLQQTYQHTQSESFFYYTQVAKCSLKSISNWNCGSFCDHHPDMVEVKAFYKSDHHAQAYVGYNKKENLVVVVYRSTQDFINWYNNIKFFKHDFGDCKNCKVHLGFWETYDDVSAEVLAAAKHLKEKYPTSKLLVTGHSLGGAVAYLAAVDLKKLGYNVDYFFTYGSPRIGSHEFAVWFTSFVGATEHWRVTHYRDMVIHQPPSSFSYKHPPQEVWYAHDNKSYKICSGGIDEDPTCANSIIGDSAADHTSYFNVSGSCTEEFTEDIEI